ncbi:MAG: hypothetical protein ABSG31_17695 [Tepidisphaeraceae bacterium]|jgi:hypothetical protein
MSRGVLYIIWGDRYRKLAERSIASLHEFHPDLPVHIHTFPEGVTLLEKAAMFDISPFDETLFLDADTMVLDRLDFGFARAQRYGLACCICECPWVRRYGGMSGDAIEYNTGVLFFTRAAKPIFDSWNHWARRMDSSSRFLGPNNQPWLMPENDQAGFAKAMEETGFNPFVLPANWNFRAEWHRSFIGPIKIWHSTFEIPPGVKAVAQQQTGEAKIMRHCHLLMNKGSENETLA